MPGYELTGKTARQHASTKKKEKHSHTYTRKCTTRHTHTHTHTRIGTQTHSCGYEGVSWQAWGQNNFLRFVMWNPAGILMTGSRDPAAMGVSCLCLTHILFIILFCNGGRKLAHAEDSSPLIISALAPDCKLRKFTDFFLFFFFSSQTPLNALHSTAASTGDFLNRPLIW